MGAVLASIGIPQDSIVKYEGELKSDRFLLIGHGTQEEVERAKRYLDDAPLTVHADTVAFIA